MKIVVLRCNKRKISLQDKVIMLLAAILLFFIIYDVALVLERNKPVIKIGVIDSLLDEKYYKKYDVVGSINLLQDSKTIDHGTNVLSIIKKDSNAQIYYVSTLDSNLRANIPEVVKGIYWCIDNKVDVINMSFATTEDNRLLKEAVQNAIDKGIVVVASCINNYNGYSYPAMYKGVLSVSDGSFSEARITVKNKESTSYGAALVTNEVSKQLMKKTN